MNTNEIIAMIVQSVLVPLLVWGILILRNYLAKQIKQEQAVAILDQATDAIAKSVAEVGQVYVDNIKGTEEWNKDAQQRAARLAAERAKQLLGQEGLAVLESTVGSVNLYIDAGIEEAVRKGK
jgi:hypothetical protein